MSDETVSPSELEQTVVESDPHPERSAVRPGPDPHTVPGEDRHNTDIPLDEQREE